VCSIIDSMFNKVAVGVDGSPGSRAALHWAADEARRNNARLVVVMAWTLPWAAYVPLSVGVAPTDALEAASAEALETLVTQELGSETGLDIERRVAMASPASALLAEQEPGALLVVSHRDRSELQELLLGSTTRSMLHRASCPVAIVPPGYGANALTQA
jgi:nucleotide-binding universal stress UspA family protein